MDDFQNQSNIIPASMPDAAIPAEKVVTKLATRRKAHRAGRFLMGPIMLTWIQSHIRNPVDRLLLVLIAHSDMRQSSEIKVTADILNDAGVTKRKAAYRALDALEANGSISLQRHKGRRPIVKILVNPNSKGWVK
jgi:hypothetical protein